MELFKLLDEISYESQLGKNLKNSLRKFDKNDLFMELKDCISFYCSNLYKINGFNFRIKSLHSLNLKYEKCFPSREAKSCFNDVISFRFLVPDLKSLLESDLLKSSNLRLVDLSNGKSIDDGYRAVHAYYQKSNRHYPIELQFWNNDDYHFQNWLHKYSYKYLEPSVGKRLRDLFDSGKISNEIDFIKCLEEI